ncbi:hypothetical protein ELH42_14610 [Rhizobium ruizarguesonis]|uniref:DUF2147 domain-containing protein n=2 Tax=Rhizobium ruizarguesonis TaxID=2081791 RepID=A0AB38ICZ4_9HYPH|nr:hypothetical protein [Rhizobium ruizarguesonis]NEI31603.1 hypothetical protein [Rhizobium ruizarguesonis]TAY95211.1 hypothetical protein ELH85_19400 [Rhizobium ruizarguesonis]TAZ81273.1 hypothetical protein ELH68_18295 [Rhizobium ruizarguesonis]TBA07628.1 hypothetical protein ELH64_16795 [Rhizobium ruizarguesonis]
MKLVLGSVILASGILLSSRSGFAASGGWQSDGQGTRYWHVTPPPGQCNISQAKNRALRAGIYRSEIIQQDDNVIVLRGLDESGDRRMIGFGNIRGCPELEGYEDPSHF